MREIVSGSSGTTAIQADPGGPVSGRSRPRDRPVGGERLPMRKALEPETGERAAFRIRQHTSFLIGVTDE